MGHGLAEKSCEGMTGVGDQPGLTKSAKKGHLGQQEYSVQGPSLGDRSEEKHQPKDLRPHHLLSTGHLATPTAPPGPRELLPRRATSKNRKRGQVKYAPLRAPREGAGAGPDGQLPTTAEQLADAALRDIPGSNSHRAWERLGTGGRDPRWPRQRTGPHWPRAPGTAAASNVNRECWPIPTQGAHRSQAGGAFDTEGR